MKSRTLFPFPRKRMRFLCGLILIPALAFLGGCFAPTPPPPPAELSVAVESVAQGFTSPITMAVPNDNTNRKFIVDQVGRIYILDANNTLLPTPFLDLADRIVPLSPDYDERGLLGLAFHPDFAVNGRFFVVYSVPKGPDVPPDWDSELHLAEFQAVGAADQADPATERLLLVIPKPQANHNGGTVAFGPDGFLYLSVGDGGGANDNNIIGHTPGIGNAQDRSNLLGKILRIDVDSGVPYGIPADNPFVADTAARPEIWAYGLRNPYRFSFDRGGTNRLFAADSGQDLWEEIDIITAGGNYGWNIREGSHCFNPQNPLVSPPFCAIVGPNGDPLIDPIMEYKHSDIGFVFGTVAVGGYVYRGSALPQLVGQYIFGDLTQNWPFPDGVLFIGTETDGGSWIISQLPVANLPNQRIGQYIKGFGEDAQGELYILTTSVIGPSGTTGQVFRIVPPSP